MNEVTRHRLTGLLLLSFVCLCSSWAQKAEVRQVLDLSGTWSFQLDPQGKGEQEMFWKTHSPETVQLPGTTDTNRKGTKNTNQLETTQLSRPYKYEGAAWYSKTVEIPAQWQGKHIVLFLERTRPTVLWIDDQKVGECHYLSTPQEYDLTPFLTPGSHKLTIRVDNGESIPGQIRSSSHACTESTQTNWNGIIGRMELQAMNPLHITSMQVFPQVATRSVKVKLSLSTDKDLNGKRLTLSASAFNTSKKHSAKPMECLLKDGCLDYEWVYPLGDKALLWSDFTPALYHLTASLDATDRKTVQVGLRDFKANGNHFTINGMKTFLRGKHDACVFPLTAHVAMDLSTWQHYFRVAKSYGINHYRFHSWCPPAACFEAADLEGIYLQPELPIWGGFKKEATELMDFLLKDGENILRQYSNYPSFVLFALGNELGGDIHVMKQFVDHFRSLEPRPMYAYGSNIFLGSRGHVPGEDFLVTCRVGSGEGYSTHARASFSFADADEGGYLNNTYPNSVMNFDEALAGSPVPVIGHETGQFQIYPDFAEMKKYTGVLAPWNFEVFRDRLKKAGMADQATDFFKASGALSVLLYRADIEMNLRSHIAGFQLLDLQDYPGQGSAYVGILDAFMDSKGLIEPAKWREFCSEVVPLLATPKFCWTGKETLSGNVEVANYGATDLKGKTILWKLLSGDEVWAQGKMNIPAGTGLLQAGTLSITLPDAKEARKVELELSIKGTSYRNHYPLWIYPANNAQVHLKDVQVAHDLTDNVMNKLRQGGKVLLMPNRKDCQETTVGGLFQSDYWNYRMFKSICDRIKKPASPGTLGLLMNPEHPLFNEFPTEYHTNWQWYPIVKQSYPFILDQMPEGYKPIVQVIDNVERNHKLGLVFELNVEGGKLLVCMADLDAAKDKPEARQFYKTMIDYMNSDTFRPVSRIKGEVLKGLFTEGVKSKKIEILENISYE